MGYPYFKKLEGWSVTGGRLYTLVACGMAFLLLGQVTRCSTFARIELDPARLAWCLAWAAAAAILAACYFRAGKHLEKEKPRGVALARRTALATLLLFGILYPLAGRLLVPGSTSKSTHLETLPSYFSTLFAAGGRLGVFLIMYTAPIAILWLVYRNHEADNRIFKAMFYSGFLIWVALIASIIWLFVSAT